MYMYNDGLSIFGPRLSYTHEYEIWSMILFHNFIIFFQEFESEFPKCPVHSNEHPLP